MLHPVTIFFRFATLWIEWLLGSITVDGKIDQMTKIRKMSAQKILNGKLFAQKWRPLEAKICNKLLSGKSNNSVGDFPNFWV